MLLFVESCRVKNIYPKRPRLSPTEMSSWARSCQRATLLMPRRARAPTNQPKLTKLVIWTMGTALPCSMPMLRIILLKKKSNGPTYGYVKGCLQVEGYSTVCTVEFVEEQFGKQAGWDELG